MILIKLVYSILIIFIAGKSLLGLKPFNVKDESPWIKCPLYFFAGTTVISLYMFVLSLLRFPFNIWIISLPFLIYLILLLPQIKLTQIDRPNFSHLDILIYLLIIVCASMLINSLIVPIWSNDAYSIWLFKAKIFFAEKTIPFNIIFKDIFEYSHADYPLLAPLNLAWISICLGQWNDTLLGAFYALQYVLFVPLFYVSIRRYLNKLNASIAAFVLFSNKHILEYAANGYSDLMLGMFIAISVIFFVRWLDKNDARYLNISSLFIGSAVFLKNDGFSPFLALLILLAIYLTRSYLSKNASLKEITFAFYSFLGISLAIFLPFKIVVFTNSISNQMISNVNVFATMAANLYRIPVIAQYFLYELYLDTFSWQYFWIILTLLVFLGRKRLFSSNIRYILYFSLISLSFYFLVYMLTVLPLSYHLESSFHRLLIGLAPAAAFLAFSSSLMEEK